MKRSTIYGVALVALGLIAVFLFVPAMRASMWSGIAWALFLMSSAIALVVLGNIVRVLYHMYTGYDSETEYAENALQNGQKHIPRAQPQARSKAPRRAA